MSLTHTQCGPGFAGNVVVFPHGLYYGRVEPADVPALLEASTAHQVELSRYRGRAAYTFQVQAAEHGIREAEGLLGIGDLTFLGCRPKGDDAWRVRFRGPERAVYEADVVSELADEPVYLTCGATEPSRPRRFTSTHVRRQERLAK